MFKKHKTRDGKTLLICQMDNDHLANTIKFFSRELRATRDMLNSTMSSSLNKADMAMFRRELDISEEDLIYKQEELLDKLSPYIMEAYVRGLQVDEFPNALNREQFSSLGRESGLLPESIDEYAEIL